HLQQHSREHGAERSIYADHESGVWYDAARKILVGHWIRSDRAVGLELRQTRSRNTDKRAADSQCCGPESQERLHLSIQFRNPAANRRRSFSRGGLPGIDRSQTRNVHRSEPTSSDRAGSERPRKPEPERAGFLESILRVSEFGRGQR